MTCEEIYEILLRRFGPDVILGASLEIVQPMISIAPAHIIEVCSILHTDSEMLFDMCSCVTGIDLGPKDGHIEVLYHLYSIPFETPLVLQAKVDRDLELNPTIPTISDIWLGAEWHEREIFDLFGLHFAGHKDLRRILLPADWEGHPLRKDYQEAEKYHDLLITYDRED